MGIVAPIAPRGSVSGENSFYRAPDGKWAQATCGGRPQQRYATGEPGKVQNRDRMGIVEGSCGYRTRGISIRGKFVLSTNPGYKTKHVAKRNSDPRVAYPEAKVKVRDLGRVVGSVAAFTPWVSILGEDFFFRATGCKRAQETCARCPQQWYATGEPGKVQGRDRVGLCRTVLWVLVPRCQYSGDNSFYRETWGTRRGGIKDPLVAYPEVKVQVRDLVRVMGIVAPFAPRVGIGTREQFVLSTLL